MWIDAAVSSVRRGVPTASATLPSQSRPVRGGGDLYNRISWDRFDVDEDFTCQDVSLYCHAYLMPEIGYHVLTVWLPYPALFGKVVTPDRWYMAITRMMETRGHHDSYSETGNVTVWE